MPPFILFIILLLSLPALGQHPVEPGKAYRLTFEAEGKGARYAIHLRDAEGNLPYDGALEADWQAITPDRKSYSHLFYAPADAAVLNLHGSDVAFTNVRLESLENENLILNGDLSEGNYSGWSETYHTELSENENQQPILRVHLNGYALSDYTPVTGGGTYELRGKQGGLLAYDSLRRLIRQIDRKGAVFQVPESAAYIRLFYKTGHDHIPQYRVNEVTGAEIRKTDAPEKAPERIDTNSQWEIVLAPSCDPREEYAARELQHWIKEITGKAPALLAEASKGKAGKIFVGRAWGDRFPDDLKALQGSDGFAIRSQEGNIYVFGAHPRGALYGVHALLERNTDIIWPRPNPKFEAFFSRTDHLPLTDADILSRPAFSSGRHVSSAYRGANPRYLFQSWGARHGLNTPSRLDTGQDYLSWLRGAKLGYGGSHLFWAMRGNPQDEKIRPLVDGKRDQSRWRQPCYSYQGTADAIAAGIRAVMDALPGREIEYISSIIADNWTVCGCPDCLAPITLPGGEKLEAGSTDTTKDPLFFSTRNFMMLNKVSEALEKDYPDLRIQTHAYIFTAVPPRVAVHPMIIPEYAAYPTQNLRYPILSGKGQNMIGNYPKGVWKDRFERWGKLKRGELGYFGYYYTGGFNAVADTAAEDYRALVSFNAIQAHTEHFPVDGEQLSIWDADGIEKWVIAKLMWDPSLDPQTLRAQFISRVYRGAEKEMTQFYQLIRDAWHNAPESVFVNCHTGPDIYQQLIVNQGIEKKMKAVLVQAEQKATHAQSKAIIGRTLAYFNQLGNRLGRITTPLVAEATNEWLEPSSPHWEKATVVEGFGKVNDWRLFDAKEPVKYATTVRFMHDGKQLYVRFDGDDPEVESLVIPPTPAGEVYPHGDRFELRVRNAKNRTFAFTLGPGGHFFALPPLQGSWKTFVSKEDDKWIGIMAIPLNLLGTAEEIATLQVRLGRVARLKGEEREESSHNGASIYNHHRALWSELQLEH